MIFCNHSEFDKLKLCFKLAKISDDSTNYKLAEVQKGKMPKLPLRITPCNKHLIKDYVIEGATYPAMMAFGGALKKYTKNFDFELLMSQFLMDVMYSTQDDGFQVDKYMESAL